MPEQTTTQCPECGAIHIGNTTCLDDFHLLGMWELDHQLYDKHHLMVLCYYLQHPSLYSPEGLQGALKMLVQFLEENISPQSMRKRIQQVVASESRAYKIKGTPDSHGVYKYPIQWTTTAKDIIEGGIEHYYENVQQWADSILVALRESGNLERK